MRCSRLCMVVLAVVLGGCAPLNPYAQFYSSALDGKPVSADTTLVPLHGEPEVRAGSADAEEDAINMVEAGFALVGRSSFWGPLQGSEMAKAKARDLQASVVLLYHSNPRAASVEVPVLDLSGIAKAISPRTETTKTSGTISGNGGSVDYRETSTKTLAREKTPPKTEPQTYTQYDQQATFWVRKIPRGLGVWTRDLTPEERAGIGANRGVAVKAVIRGGPAFLGDMLRGDVIMKIGDSTIRETSDVAAAADRYAGEEVEVVVKRGTTEKTLRVQLRS